MSLNLHAAVRGAINAVNPDMLITWLASTGYTTDTGGKPTPTYTVTADVQAQVQAVTGPHLKHEAFVAQQGVKRVVYLFGNKQGMNRPDAKGGDLLVFPENRGGANVLWLVTHVLETWNPDATGWCSVGVVLQVEPNP